MSQLTMYPGQVNSPEALLASNIDSVQTTIPLNEASILPDAPNIATIGRGENAETILYTGKDGNNLTGVTRGFQGTASAWSSGTRVRRTFTEYDWESIRQNHMMHLAEDVTYITVASRDLTIAGTQTIALPAGKTPKCLLINVNVNNSKKACWSQIRPGIAPNAIYMDGTSGNIHNSNLAIVMSQDTVVNRTRANISFNVGSIDLDWAVLSGTGATGTATIHALAVYHGGA